MCLRTCNVRSTNRWNWDGDLILRDTTVRVGRRNPATRRPFRIDLREFLGTVSNSVVGAALDAVVASLSCSEQLLFRSRAQGSFDLRVRAITAYLARSIRYEGRGRAAEDWLFPDETLDAGFGDCEDLAFLLAALLLASGVSGYVVRVAFGTLHVGRGKRHDHAWVMYRDEGGRWLLLDPLLSTRQLDAPGVANRRRPERSEYEPRFVFNDAHLWAMKPGRGSPEVASYLGERKFLEGFDPTFAAGIHNMIYDSALKDMGWVDRNYVKAVSLAVDGDTVNYDPRDHFDNAYMEAGWARVRERLATGRLGDFALAAHSIGDFYAHSSYGHFALEGDKLAPLDERTAGAGPNSGPAPTYSSGAFTFSRFTRNEERCTLTRAEAEQAWAGSWISGRYAQPDDPEQGFIERVLTPYPNRLEKKSELGPRACLPHHNEIAVDKKIRDSVPHGHRLYGADDYKTQFEARWQAASNHLADAYLRWKANGFGA
jgi:hypothetical protein